MDTVANPSAGGTNVVTIESNVDSPRVHIILDDEPMPATLAEALDRTSAAATILRLGGPWPGESQADPDAVIVVAPRDQKSAEPQIEQVFLSLAERPCGTLVLTHGPVNGLASVKRPPGLPVSFAVNPSVEELTAQLLTICEFGRALRHITRQAEHMIQKGRRLVRDANQLDEQLRLASQVQRDFLPRRAPHCEGARFVTLFRPADYVSGDIYDLTRLDETHVGIAVADVTGHGVPAALLTLFIKRAWRAKEIDGSSYRIIPPDELLRRLNRDVIDADLQQCQFVTACCAVYEQSQRVITWARGGLPYPILVRHGEPPRQIRTSGELVGAFEHASFELRSERLRPGDAMLFFSDGLEALLLGKMACHHEFLEHTRWFTELGVRPIEDQIQEIRRRLDETPHDGWPRDDVTIVALVVEE